MGTRVEGRVMIIDIRPHAAKCSLQVSRPVVTRPSCKRALTLHPAPCTLTLHPLHLHPLHLHRAPYTLAPCSPDLHTPNRTVGRPQLHTSCALISSRSTYHEGSLALSHPANPNPNPKPQPINSITLYQESCLEQRRRETREQKERERAQRLEIALAKECWQVRG